MQSMKINVMYRVSPLVNHLSATHLFCPSRRVRNPNAPLEEDSPVGVKLPARIAHPNAPPLAVGMPRQPSPCRLPSKSLKQQGSTILRTHSTWSGTSKARGPESRMRQRCHSGFTPLSPTCSPLQAPMHRKRESMASALTPVDVVNIAEATEPRLSMHRRCWTLFLEFGQAHGAMSAH